MLHRRWAVVSLFLVLPVTVTAGTECGGACAAALEFDDPPAFDRWANGPVRYLLSEKEKKIADALSSPGHLTAFRHWFWERRDASPETAANEFRERFNRRVDHANKEFGNRRTGVPGWLTPKGVVYIMLGPPTRIARAAGRVHGNFSISDVEVWIYEFERASVLEVPFVKTADGFALLTTFDNLSMRTRLDAALRRAAEGFIHNRDLPFAGISPLVDAPAEHAWPATGSLCRTNGGFDGQVSIPLAELYGRPEGDNLRVDLRFEAETPSGGEATVLGNLTVLLRHEVFERWPDRPLTIALWLADDDAFEAAPRIVVTEVASGRTVRLTTGTRTEAVARAYPVAELVGRARLLGRNGAAFAFIEGADDTEAANGAIWVLRPPRELGAVILEQPVASLWLVRGRSR